MKVKDMKWYRIILFSAVFGTILFSGCNQSKYDWVLAQETALGGRNDSLFLDIELGMTSKAFFDHCYQLNQRRLVKDGPGGRTVEYRLPGYDPEIMMNFHGDFYENKLYEMQVDFNYVAWGPWNRELWSDSLQVKLLEVLQDWYGGNEFFEVRNSSGNEVMVKIDGNRRILVYPTDDQYVEVIFTDMLAKQKKDEEEQEASGPEGLKQ